MPRLKTYYITNNITELYIVKLLLNFLPDFYQDSGRRAHSADIFRFLLKMPSRLFSHGIPF